MHDTTTLGPAVEATSTPTHIEGKKDGEVVSTHVLVEQEKVDRLRELSRRTRIAQSEYLREAVDDLLEKYKEK
ncbi:MAG: ribbon-helix-helix domain-containing protein [Archangium sp.]